jgi:aldehyde dehydrogenase (NAD+)
MPRPNQNAGSLAASIQPEEIAPMMVDLRASFNNDLTRSRSWRISQLDALSTMITECHDELCDAVWKDLHKDKFQVFIQELALIHQEIYDAKKHLDTWMADETVGTGLMNAPGTSLIQKDPLGVVLVLGAW